MSQHNIVGSEAFARRPQVYIRTLRRGAYHRRRGRLLVAFVAGAVVAIAGLTFAALAWTPQFGG
ncbi:MAG: hypothetical protein J0L52_02050 [Caulobacterales bacterium]|nr:hypothetical protein [Caulobacterales bacterium]